MLRVIDTWWLEIEQEKEREIIQNEPVVQHEGPGMPPGGDNTTANEFHDIEHQPGPKIATPSAQPASEPGSTPSAQPACESSSTPNDQPSSEASSTPSAQPSSGPSSAQSAQSSSEPSTAPSTQITSEPSSTPNARHSVVVNDLYSLFIYRIIPRELEPEVSSAQPYPKRASSR